MKAVAVNCIPEVTRYHKLQAFLKDFMQMNVKFAKIELSVDEYASPTVARGCIAIAAARGKYPVKVRLRGKDIYLIRTDM
ncbi:MAG: hypothetical protein IKZ08_02505 [Bacteroidales bacterium]|nr:hypothetical protein [Bacteroidales bacterium]